jgi:hypothetical protein
VSQRNVLSPSLVIILGLHVFLKCWYLPVSCRHGMARPQVAVGGDGLQIWRVAANILNKQ